MLLAAGLGLRSGSASCRATCSPISRPRSSTSSCRTPAMGAEELETGHRHSDGGRRSAGLPDVRRMRSTSQLGRRPDHRRVRARRRLLPVAAVRRRARRAGGIAAAARYRRAVAVEPDRPPQRDLRVHAGGGAGRRGPDDAARPRRVRGEEPPARRARGRGRRAARGATSASSRSSSIPIAHGGARASRSTR